MGKTEFKCVLCKSTIPEVTLFRFPPDNSIKKQWLDFCRIENHNTYTRLCHLHFRTDLISNAGSQGRHVLKRGAIPSIEVQRNENDTRETKEKHRCCYLCKNTDDTSSYFGMKKEWVDFCNVKKSGIPPRSARLCSNHFTPDDFVNTGSIVKRLKKGAMPTIYVEESNNNNVAEFNPVVQRSDEAMPLILVQEMPNDNDVVSSNAEFNPVFQRSDEAMPLILVQEMPNDNVVVNCPTPDRDADCEILSSTPAGPSRASARRLYYVGDVTTPDLTTPRRARKCFEIARAAVTEKDRTIKTLRQKQRRLSKRITTLEKLVEHLQDKNLISEQAKNLLIVRLQNLET